MIDIDVVVRGGRRCASLRRLGFIVGLFGVLSHGRGSREQIVADY